MLLLDSLNIWKEITMTFLILMSVNSNIYIGPESFYNERFLSFY